MEQQQTIPQTALEWCRIHYPDRMYEWNLRKMTEYAEYYHAAHTLVPRLTQEEVWVIMPRGVGNVLAWSGKCWLTKEAAQQEIDGIAQGDESYREKWWIQSMRIQGYNAANTVCSTG